MADNILDQLADLIRQERSSLLSRWRTQVRELPSARHLDVPTLTDHMPGLLEELAHAMVERLDQTIPEALSEGSPVVHGLQRLQEGFDIEEVVAEYNILRGCIHDLADEHGLNLRGAPFHIVNRVLDSAIGVALQAYATQRALEVQRRREEYLAFVAHDLRTPLNAISLGARFLEGNLQRVGVTGDASRMMTILRRNVKQLEELVSKVLEENTNLQEEAGVKLERRKFYLWPVVEALVEDLRAVAGTTGTTLVNLVPDDLVLYADASLMKRVLQNLLANAIRYTPSGEVSVGARALGDDGQVECWVADDGAGIPGERLDRIFDIGESDPTQDGSTGLGLAIVKTLVEGHGGRVTVESVEATGSTFRITLPGKAD